MTKTAEQVDQQFKSWLSSKTIWGIIIALAPIISSLLGFDISTEVGGSYEEIIQIIGSSLALYGRWKANGQIVVSKAKAIRRAGK